VSFKNLVSTCL